MVAVSEHTAAGSARSGMLARSGHGHAAAVAPQGTSARPPASPVPSSSSSHVSTPPESPPGFGEAEAAPWHAFQRTASVKSRRYLEAAERIATALTVDSIQRKLCAARGVRAGTECTLAERNYSNAELPPSAPARSQRSLFSAAAASPPIIVAPRRAGHGRAGTLA